MQPTIADLRVTDHRCFPQSRSGELLRSLRNCQPAQAQDVRDTKEYRSRFWIFVMSDNLPAPGGESLLYTSDEEGEETTGDNERAGIAADGHPAGTPGATGVERLRPRENGQRLGGGGLGKRTDLSDGFVRPVTY